MREYQHLLNVNSTASSHLILWMTLLFFIVAGWWASYTTLDEVTRGTGKVIPSRHVQVVQNLEGGIVSEILAKEGDVVEKEQILLRIDDTRFASSYRESQLKEIDLKAKISRLTAEVEGKDLRIPNKLSAADRQVFSNEEDLLRSRRREMQSGIDVITQQKAQKEHEINELASQRAQFKNGYDLANKELKITEPLVKRGVMSEVDLLRLQREAVELKGKLDSTYDGTKRAKSALAELDRKIEELRASFRTRALTELNDVKAELSRIGESNLALKDRVVRTAVRSPVKGTIKQIKVTTVGGVVQPGMDLVEIVPLEDTLLIEAQIRPADIAFLRAGQAATVKFTAYDFSIFGGLSARLERISADTIINERGESFFSIAVRTDRNYLGSSSEPLPIIPGMIVSVDILTGKKTLLDYLLKPIKKAQHMALRER